MTGRASGPLTGRLALVTGGSRGVGKAIALRLAAEGATVAVNYRQDAEAAAAVVEAISAAGGRAKAYAAAIDDPDAVGELVESVRADLGDVDLLVSNAGTASTGRSVVDTADREYLRLLGVHALGPVRLIRELLPAMRRGDRSDIVLISSAITDSAPPNSAPYTMAKAALEALARTLAVEEREHGVRVNVVAPDLVATDMGQRLVKALGAGRELSSLDRTYPFGRVCRPADIAGVVAFLVSADAEYLTGQRILVNGGGNAPSVVSFS